MKKKINIIIQARLQSSRLKKKIMLEINEKPLLFYIIERVKKIPGINKIILSTSNYSKNLELIEYSRNLGIDVYHEDTMHENDLCSRFYNT
jgi:spore coat polysaccharide biosynthesis protein SpsF